MQEKMKEHVQIEKYSEKRKVHLIGENQKIDEIKN